MNRLNKSLAAKALLTFGALKEGSILGDVQQIKPTSGGSDMIATQRFFLVKLGVTGIALAVGLLVLTGSRAAATPFTDHFDTLIADLQSRAGTLSNSTDKVQQKQFKTVEKVLKKLEFKPSSSLGSDVKNLGKTAKTLVKAFPDDFGTPGGPFQTDLETALQGLIGDVQASVDSTQAILDGLGGSSCATKAQTTLTGASNLVVEATAAADFASASKLLGSGLKSALKANKAAIKCAAANGGGNGDFMKATISGDFNLNFTAVPGSAVATIQTNIDLLIIAGASGSVGGTGIGVTVKLSTLNGPDTYPIDPTSNVVHGNPPTGYGPGVGTITFTTLDLANQKLVGMFNFTANLLSPPGSGSVTVTNGTFSISKIDQH
jgi:hypothetical protein